jgi:hypothetical protein
MIALGKVMLITFAEFFEILPTLPNAEFDGLKKITTRPGCIAHPGQAKPALNVRFCKGHLQILPVIQRIDFFGKHADRPG